MIGRAELEALAAAVERCNFPAEALDLARRFAPGPDRAAALQAVGIVLATRLQADASAAAAFAEATKDAPSDPEPWLNLAAALGRLWRPVECLVALQRAETLLTRNDHHLQASAFNTRATALLRLRRVSEAEAAAFQALALAPGHDAFRATLANIRYAAGDWRGSLELVSAAPEEQPLRQALGDLPAWRGQRVRRLVLYGVNGLGDEVRAASMVAEATERAQHVVLECAPRLHRLFAGSFPRVEVRGTRGMDVKPWTKSRRFDAQASTEWLAPVFGRTHTGRPYLIPDVAERRHWREVFGRLPRPVVGIAWSGGSPWTGAPTRAIGLAALAPLILATRATFVSLQYRDAAAEIAASGLPVVQYPEATLARDYGKTAALVAELDAIVGPPTSVHHLAAALGKESTVLVPSLPPVDYVVGDCSMWFPSQRCHRQRDGESWADCVARLDMQAVIGRQA